MALPLPVRNRLAELILDAFDDREDRRTIRALVDFCEARPGREDEGLSRLDGLGWFRRGAGGGLELLGAHRNQRDAICSRARAAAAMLESDPGRCGEGLERLLVRAARLADHGLYFEVHELLEPVWLRAEGHERIALQGVIQVAVAFHHLQGGNLAGAASRFVEGLSKLQAAGHMLPLSTESWVHGLHRMLAGLGEGELPGPVPPWPRPGSTREPRRSA